MKQMQYLLLKAFLTFLLVILGFIFQTGIFRGLRLAGVCPNFMIMITSTLGLMRGSKTGAATGFLCGMFVDLYVGYYFGFYTLIFTLLGYINGVFNRMVFGESIRLPIIMVAFTDMLYGWIVYLVLFFSRHRTDTMFYLNDVIMPELVYTIVVYMIIFFLLYRFNLLLDSIDKRSSRRVA